MDFINAINCRKNGPFRLKVRNRKNSVNISLCYKYAAAISASITVAGYGMIISWTSPALPHLTNPTSSFPITEMQGAWVASLLSFGIISGYVLNPFLIDTIGSKRTLLFLSIPQILSCLLIYFGQNWIVLCAARIIGGIGYGGGLCSTAVYVSQIGDENNRGFFLTFVKMFFNIGVFVTMIFGAFLTYNIMNLAILGIPLVFVVSFFFMPDTDQFCEKGEYVQEKLTENGNDERQKSDERLENVNPIGGAENSKNAVVNCDHVITNSNHAFANSDHGIKNSKNVATNSDHDIKNSDHGIKTSDHGIKNCNHGATNSDHVAKNTHHVTNVDDAENPDGVAKNPNEASKNQNSACQNPKYTSSNANPDEVVRNPENMVQEGPNGTAKNPKAQEVINIVEIGQVPPNVSATHKSKINANKTKSQKNNWYKLFFLRNNRRALIIIISASMTEILSGHMAIVSFAQQIFEYSSFLRAEYAALILAGLKIGASFFSTLVVEKFERRHIFLITGILASLSQAAVGLFFFLKLFLKMDVSSITWLPLVGVSAYEVVGSIGMSSLYYVYQGELFADEIKGQGVTCTNIFYEIITFLVKLNFQLVIDAIGIYSVFLAFSVCCAIGSCVTFCITPETKGKSRIEIQKLLGDKSEDLY